MGILNISGLAKIVGMNVHTIRAWERRYKALQPERSPSGQRTYSIEDVEKLKKLKHLNHMGMSIGRIANLSLNELTLIEQDHSLTNQPDERASVQTRSEAITDDEIHKIILNTIDCLYQYDVDTIHQQLNKYRIQMSAKDFILKVISPLFNMVNRLVLELKLNIAQEHILFAVVRDQISFLITPVTNDHARRVALASPEGDVHEIGIILSHVLCISNDMKSYYLGTNLPLQSLVEVTDSINFKYIILGCSSQNLGYEKLTFNEYIDQYLESAQSDATILITGKTASSIDISGYGGRVQHVESLQALDSILDMRINGN
ncbi:MAG: MerR family transcriptional regulator [Bdellovibrionales bacterium]|nr:MerR family transcriptional regulator [Bdellovibrionales bacterium]